MTIKLVKKRAKKTTQPTRILKNLLKLINLVPVTVILPEGKDFTEEDLRRIERQNLIDGKTFDYPENENAIQARLERIRSQTKDYPLLLKEISAIFCDIWEMEYDPNDYFGELLQYDEFLRIKGQMHYIAAGSIVAGNRAGRKMAINSIYGDLVFNTRLEIDDDGILTFEKDILFLALEGIELNRLRICEICERIFWAYRMDKNGCSSKCNNIRRTRLLRKKRAGRFPSRVLSKGL